MFHFIYFLTLGAITKLKYFLKHEKLERFLESEKNDKKTLSARKVKNGFKSLSFELLQSKIVHRRNPKNFPWGNI